MIRLTDSLKPKQLKTTNQPTLDITCPEICIVRQPVYLPVMLKMIGKGFIKVSKKQFQTVYYNANTCG